MTNNMLSQEEIDALLKGDSSDEETVDFHTDDINDFLTEIEIDTLGEIGNISMGTAATALSTLLNKTVNITTPTVTMTTVDELTSEYKLPLVAIDVSYTAGLEGSNILLVDTEDVKIITDLMMGKEDFDISRDLSEFDLSAVSEAMNQMMGSASTSMSEMFTKKIEIAPPKSLEIVFSEDKNEIDLLKSELPIIKISFKMVIGDIIDSNIMQLIPLEFGREMVKDLFDFTNTPDEPEIIEKPIEENELINYENLEAKSQDDRIIQKPTRTVAENRNINYNDISKKEDEKVLVQKAEFQSFDTSSSSLYNEPIDLVGDIPVEITVELGRTNKKISEILEFGQGTVVELDKLVGEPLSIFANGKFIAKGEVVVIDDSFGVRVTEIEKTNKAII